MNRFQNGRLFVLALLCAMTISDALAAGTSTTVKPVGAPPYYRGKPSEARPTAHLPVTVQPPAELPESWTPAVALSLFAARMTTWLDEEGATLPLPPIPAERRVVAPLVYFGCEVDLIGECSLDPRENVLAVTSGSRDWRARIGESAARLGVERVLVVQIALAQHWVHQKNLRGAKEVRLGTGHAQALPWLSSLDSPLWVIEITGTIVDREGTVLRSGAEGLRAVRTPFRASIVDVQRLFDPAEVDFVREELRRGDDAAAPLLWEDALRELVAQLTGVRSTGGPE